MIKEVRGLALFISGEMGGDVGDEVCERVGKGGHAGKFPRLGRQRIGVNECPRLHPVDVRQVKLRIDGGDIEDPFAAVKKAESAVPSGPEPVVATPTRDPKPVDREEGVGRQGFWMVICLVVVVLGWGLKATVRRRGKKD
jgi:hypothetical protein